MKVKIQMLELEVEGEGVAEIVAATLEKFLTQSTMREITPKAACVACPKCGAAPGRQCESNGRFYTRQVHAERDAAALGKER